MNPDDEDFLYFKKCLEKLIELNLIDDKATLGITKKVMEEGVESLSQKQKYIFDTNVKNKFFDRTCSNCKEEIPWCEMPQLIEEDVKTCGACIHDSEKND